MTALRRADVHRLAIAAVVVGADGSAAADRAVRWAAATAAQRGRKLLIVHGLNLAATRATFGCYDVMVPAVTEKMRAHGEHVLAQAHRLAIETAPELGVDTELSEANPAELLIALSRTAHLVVLGATPGVGAFAHLGSTLLAVTRHGEGSIVVVREGEPDLPDRRPVVLGVDGSQVGESAIAAAFSEAAERAVQLIAVHAWSDLSVGAYASMPYLDLPLAHLETTEHALLAERLAGWQAKYPNVAVARRIYPAGPRTCLQDWSKSAQLIVVGNRGRGGFRDLLLGSTTNWLVQHAHCPVMVVHPE
ncbi:nucleotide-binding universal stress UspA family protein [Nocardia tenerifensis]|uniref:Nucleotide-binding universal stress UspA family protein n=1 Tax=Nocardia tenerifensis TaxID=228006 RepID=A0A318KGM4_9NOCA|nr:universal stress protein [Nocardia tenerifensis]PXX71412.1 nucleotide-binding universal stress UspA family protein [Nocardia tenerifensis]